MKILKDCTPEFIIDFACTNSDLRLSSVDFILFKLILFEFKNKFA